MHFLESIKDVQQLTLLDYVKASSGLPIPLLLIHDCLRVLCLLIEPDMWRYYLCSPLSAYIRQADKGQAGTCVQMHSTYIQ